MSQEPTPQATWAAVDDYFAETLVPSDAALDATLATNAAAGLPAIDVAPNQGKFLQLLAKLVHARRILEIGTLGGYSTINMARALPADDPTSCLITLEFEPLHAATAKANIANAGLSALVDIRVGPALDSLAELVADQTESFDMIFIDADKPNNPHYLDFALKLSHPGTLILVDNIVRDGAIVDAASTDPRVQGQRITLAAMAANPRLSSTALQTVGSKGYDGFAMAIVLG